MAAKKKAAKKKAEKPAAEKSKSNGQISEPLSNFQDLSKTGRTDPASSNGKQAIPTSQVIRKVKLVDDDYLEIEFSKTEADGSKPKENYENRARPVHPDFRKALDKLRLHWGILVTFLDAKKKKSVDDFDEEDLSPFTITGVSMGKNENDPGVIITGYKTRDDGKILLINTPFERYDRADGEGYKFIEDLEEDIENVLMETRLYIGGKRDASRQTEMDFPEGQDHEEAAEEA